MSNPVQLRLTELRVPMKMTFRHASAARKEGESVWAESAREGVRGYGEGCPRPYVTGETLESCRAWMGRHLGDIQASCTSLDDLQAWADDNAAVIDRSPSMWCALEGSLLDLFARERGVSIEALLGRDGPGGPHVYSAVLGNDEAWKTQFLIDQYLIMGLRDFKVKLCGDLELDSGKLDSIEELSAEHAVSHAVSDITSTAGRQQPVGGQAGCRNRIPVCPEGPVLRHRRADRTTGRGGPQPHRPCTGDARHPG